MNHNHHYLYQSQNYFYLYSAKTGSGLGLNEKLFELDEKPIVNVILYCFECTNMPCITHTKLNCFFQHAF